MIATNRPTAATTEIIATGKRHHGRRLARKVDTGTDAAATEITRTRDSVLTRLASDPSRPF